MQDLGTIAFEKEALKATNVVPSIPEACISTSFSHIFSGGYSAAYYSYKWSEGLEADAFSLFKEKGIFSAEVAASFRDNILSRGCTEGEAILYHLSDAGICASSGSACTSGSLEPSHVIRAMGVPFTAVHGSIRFSFSKYNTESDVDRVLAVVPGVVDKLRKLSPFVK